MKTGMTSITFRKLTAEQVIDLVKKAGLDGIEWGGDIHARPDNLERAKEIGELTRAAGLEVLSYGSYYFVGKEGNDFEPISKTAQALGCSIIRIWMPWDDYDYVSHKEEIDRISAIAASRGQTLAFEFHCKTANDLVSRSVAMLNCFGKENVKTYWQPPYWSQTPPDSLDDLEELVPYVVNLHVYRWKGETNDRLPLSKGVRAWKNYLEIFSSANAAILEFTANEDPENFLADAKTLKALLSAS